MPAAAVIPAPIAYIKVVAVKKLVVGLLGDGPGPVKASRMFPFRGIRSGLALGCRGGGARRLL